MHFLFQYFQVS